jgi:regulatory protein
VVVFVDGAEAFTVSEELADRMGLKVGQDLAPVSQDLLTTNDDRSKAREAALRLLAVRARSEGELRDRLRRKAFDEEIISGVLASLAEVGLVDDAAFAKAWADERVRLRPVGPVRLRQELLAKRVDAETAARVVDETYREHPELELARRALEKKSRVSGGADDSRRRARLHSFLLRRGFSYEVASAALKELKGESDA